MALSRGAQVFHRRGPGGPACGRALQADPMKPKLKPPGTKRLKLNRDILLSTSAFKFTLRCYNAVWERMKRETYLFHYWNKITVKLIPVPGRA